VFRHDRYRHGDVRLRRRAPAQAATAAAATMSAATNTLTGAVASIGDKLVTALPAQFLLLVLLNVFFVLGLLWFLHATDATRSAAEEHAADIRERMLAPILTECIRQSNIVHPGG
jgi:hypothetical protein